MAGTVRVMPIRRKNSANKLLGEQRVKKQNPLLQKKRTKKSRRGKEWTPFG